MRVMWAIAGLLALMPAGARAQDLPLWLAGTWCPRGAEPELTTIAPADPALPVTITGHSMQPWLGPQCVTWVVKDGVMLGEQRTAYSGRNDSFVFMRIGEKRGRLEYGVRVDQGFGRGPGAEQRMREVSRGPTQVAFARGRFRSRFVREGDVLTLEESWIDGKLYSSSYRLAKPRS
ncbi:hypothetical protein OF829_02540 [Sphingomonas sp. LB-2]|uniref:hypothetical protein n=1 Tax=Sphingomonas caeni TaxID=2984949 RepID=UPI002230FA6E|nr:hypothetical protein [Sphingomonas caeni]MCW3846099.1 hypothetical protein [Sphingomonas caeni]